MMRLPTHLLALAAACSLGGVVVWRTCDSFSSAHDAAWTRRDARHLLNRAGFGGTPAEVDAALAAGRDAQIERLLAGADLLESYPVVSMAELLRRSRPGPVEDWEHRVRVANQEQLRGYILWWIDEILSARDPLRERLTLFWHGFFTTSIYTVRDSAKVLEQHEFLRRNAFGNYAELLRGIVHDPAMLVYLDGHVNHAGSGNENFARELLELFSLGEGHYSESDVREVARCLTGLGYDDEGAASFDEDRHDRGVKHVLGRVGAFGPDDVVDILLEQPECARWVARNLLAYLEGVPPDDARVDAYARVLRDHDYELEPLLRRLFRDPDFYDSARVGTRIQSPLDYFVGVVHRCRLPVTPRSVRYASALLGEELMAPPSVEGWPRGGEWATSSGLLMRANYTGVLLGLVELAEIHSMAVPEPDRFMDESAPFSSLPPTGLRALRERRLQMWAEHLDEEALPDVHLSGRLRADGVRTDRDVTDWLLERALAIEAPADLRDRLEESLRRDRAEFDLSAEDWLERAGAERVLRRALHRTAGTPAAQLH